MGRFYIILVLLQAAAQLFYTFGYFSYYNKNVLTVVLVLSDKQNSDKWTFGHVGLWTSAWAVTSEIGSVQ